MSSEQRMPPLGPEAWTAEMRKLFTMLEGPDAYQNGSKSNAILTLARHTQLRAFALENDLERFLVLHVLVDLHVGRRIVAPVHPAAAYPALALDCREQAPDAGARLGESREVHLVIDVVVQIGRTARSSAPPSAGATSTTVPPLNSCPGWSATPAGARACTMRRFTCPRYCARATISCPG